MQRILVTGAGGYIGTVLVPMLLERGYAVRAIDRFFFGVDLLRGAVPDHARTHLEIVREDTRCLTPAHFTDVDAVIDLAAISNDPSGELFQDATWAINHRARARAAALAKRAGVTRYILPSSCSIYGRQQGNEIADETSATYPLTTYAQANERAEQDILPLADEAFTVVVLRQATVYGLSPRMRFDLAINGMTYGAHTTGTLPVMRDGTQWRPMVHVRDTAAAQIFMLDARQQDVNGQIFNVGSAANTYQIKPLAEIVARTVPRDVCVEWYGDPDERSYRVGFDKIEKLGWKANLGAEDGVREIVTALEAGRVARTPKTVTLDWYKELAAHPDRYPDVILHGGMVDLSGFETPDPLRDCG